MLDTTPHYPLAWRPDRGLDKSIESIGSDCLIMSNDPRNAADAKAKRLTKRRHGWFLDEERIARRQAEIAAEAEALFQHELRHAPEACGLCYFIGCSEGLVKIGFTRSLPQRFNLIKSSSLYKLSVLATARGGRATEMHYHARFKAHAVGNEWFERCPEIDAEIAFLNSIEGQPA